MGLGGELLGRDDELESANALAGRCWGWEGKRLLGRLSGAWGRGGGGGQAAQLLGDRPRQLLHLHAPSCRREEGEGRGSEVRARWSEQALVQMHRPHHMAGLVLRLCSPRRWRGRTGYPWTRRSCNPTTTPRFSIRRKAGVHSADAGQRHLRLRVFEVWVPHIPIDVVLQYVPTQSFPSLSQPYLDVHARQRSVLLCSQHTQTITNSPISLCDMNPHQGHETIYD